MSIEIGDGGLGYVYLGDTLIAGGGGSGGGIPTNGLLAHRTFETNGADDSGNGNDATIYGCTFGNVGDKKGVRLETSNLPVAYNPENYIISSLSYNSTTSITIITWVYWLGLSDWASVMGNGLQNISGTHPDSTNNLAIRTNTASVYANTYNSLQGPYLTASLNQRYMIGITIDGASGALYVNGEKTSTFTAGSNNSSTGPRAWGHQERYAGAGNPTKYAELAGWVRHSAVYNRPLTADEMLTYYNATL